MDIKHQKPGKTGDEIAAQAKKLPVRRTRTTLHQLNDDCLLSIFSLKLLSLMDLCSVAETCRRFKQIIQNLFPKKISIHRGWKRYYIVADSINLYFTEVEIQRIFKNFGLSLSSICHSSNYERGEYTVLNLLARHCYDPCCDSLDSLKITHLKLPQILTAKLKPIFQRLRQLHLKENSVEDETLFANCDSLIELKIHWVKNSYAILGNAFPKLERFNYLNNENVIYKPLCGPDGKQSLSAFISRQKTLKTIDISYDCDYEDYRLIISEAIGNSCNKIEELSINLGRTKIASLQPLQALRSLKHLKLWCVSFEDFHFFSPLTGLRELHLIDCPLPEDPKQFDFLINLTELKMKKCDSPETLDFVAIVNRLINLEKLTIIEPWSKSRSMEIVLDEKSFFEIVGIVKGRPNVLTLKCRFDFSSDNFDDNQKVRLLKY